MMNTIRHQSTLLLAIACLLIVPERANAQWSTDPTVNKAICTASNDQLLPAILSDGSGGAIITWSDSRSGTSNSNIYAQRINSVGAVQWTSNGVAICTAVNSQVNPAIISDGNGGAIITWRDPRASIFNNDIYAQRIDANGLVQWTTNGVVVCSATNHQTAPVIASDSKGGAIISWIDQRNGNDADVYTQRINSLGEVQWTANGVAINTLTFQQYVSSVIADDKGGAILCWSDGRSGNVDIYAQRIDSSGVVKWTSNGIAVRSGSGTQDYSSIVSDSSGGAIITWLDNFSGSTDVYAQRIDSNGAVQWTGSGVAICTATDNQEVPKIATDGNHGAIITWSDLRSGTQYDLYAQRIAANGIVQWTTNGTVISSASSNQTAPTITPDGSGGAIIAWIDNRSRANDIYLQRINAAGAVQWTSDGVAIATATGSQGAQQIMLNTNGEAIITWEDFRGGSTSDVYITRVSSEGALPVELTSFTAVGQGSSVLLNWNTATEVNNYGFEIERKKIRDSRFRSQDTPESSIMSPASTWSRISFVEGNGTTNSPKEYSFSDNNIQSSGKYLYRLKQIDRDGKFEYSQAVEVTIGSVPKDFALIQNYPNPFNPTTTIGFTLQASGPTTLKIYDAIGREVATLVDEFLDAGVYHQNIFNASNLPSGIYFAKLSSEGKSQIRKLMLLK